MKDMLFIIILGLILSLPIIQLILSLFHNGSNGCGMGDEEE